MRQYDNIKEFLFSIDLFRDLPHDCEFDYHVEQYQKSDIIFDHHKGIESLGIVYQGQLSASNIAIDGNELLISSFYPKDFFGLCNLFSTTPLPLTLKCLCSCSIIYIPKNDFLRLMNTNLSLMIRIMEFYNHKIMFLQKKIELLNITSPKTKIWYYIFSNRNHKNEFHFTCSKCELCNQIGIGRASLYRGLEEMKELACLDISENKIVIKDPDAFKQHIFMAG